MEAIQLNHLINDRARMHRYACRGISVTPNPPQVGVPTTITLYLRNSESSPVTVTRIETKVAQFGMGVAWEELPVVGPFSLPADPNHVEEVTMQWTPQKGGHRCLRANIYLETLPQPLMAGCNLHVIESEAERSMWQMPFRLGNPERERMPVALEIGGNQAEGVAARLIVKGGVVRPGEAVWLDAGEEVDALLLLRARTAAAIESIHTVEAFINGRFLDGIQVELYRPAQRMRPVDHHLAPQAEPVIEQITVSEDSVLLVH